jgi:hypothetical protein
MNEHRKLFYSFIISNILLLVGNRLIGKSDGHNHHTANGDSSTIAPPLPQIINETKTETSTGIYTNIFSNSNKICFVFL